MNLVLDASMALAWVFERSDAKQRDRADRALQTLAGASALVPALWHAEVANGLLVGERRAVIQVPQSMDYLRRLERLPITVDAAPAASHRDTVMKIARKYALSAYDACYLELASRTAATLATFDIKLACAAQAAGVTVFE